MEHLSVIVLKDTIEGKVFSLAVSGHSPTSGKLCTSDREKTRESSTNAPHKCGDIDECIIGTHTCHHDAICANNIGSYECHCIDGFTGLGISVESGSSGGTHPDSENGCTDDDECVTETHACVQNRNRFQPIGLFNR